MRNMPHRPASPASGRSLVRGLGLLLPLALSSLVGCKTECQKLCKDMAAYAEECGFTVSEEDLDACMESNTRKATSEDYRAECEAFRPTLKDEWTCEEVEANLLGQGNGGAGSGEDSADDTGA
jgi:hypothetical protein